MTSHRRSIRRFSIVVVLLALAISPAIAEDAVQDALRSGGHIVLIRHALAPGTGDPANFNLEDTATQRNLSESGRRQARTIGQRLKEAGIRNPQIFSSQWNRCMETASLMNLGEVFATPALNSFFADRSKEPATMQAVRELMVEEQRDDRTLVFVTHQVNITALTGIFPASGEIIVLRMDEDEPIIVDRIKH